MRSDVLRRVRWGNVARAVGVVAAVGAIVAWPRLTPPGPALPGREVRPLVEPAGGERIERGERRRRRRGHLVRRREPVVPREVPARGVPQGGGEGSGGGARGGATPAPVVRDPAQVEFGIEGG